MCYGIPLGSDEFVSLQLEQKSKEIIDDSVKMVEMLSGDIQALRSMLWLFTMSRFEYFAQLTQPSLSETSCSVSWLSPVDSSASCSGIHSSEGGEWKYHNMSSGVAAGAEFSRVGGEIAC